MAQPIRKRRRVYNEPGHAHYLTYFCKDRLPLLSTRIPLVRAKIL